MKDLLLAIVLFGGSIILLLYLGNNVTPFSPLFPLERVDESVILLTKYTPQAKVNYDEYLIQKRFTDLTYILHNNHNDFILPVSLRYASTIGKTVELIHTHNLQEPKLKEQLATEAKQLNTMIKNYHFVDDRKKYLIDARNYITMYQQQL